MHRVALEALKPTRIKWDSSQLIPRTRSLHGQLEQEWNQHGAHRSLGLLAAMESGLGPQPAPLYVPAPFPILNGDVESMLTQLLHVVPQPVVFEQGTICESAAWHIAAATRRLHEVSEEQSEFKFSRPSRSCTMKKMEETARCVPVTPSPSLHSVRTGRRWFGVHV